MGGGVAGRRASRPARRGIARYTIGGSAQPGGRQRANGVPERAAQRRSIRQRHFVYDGSAYASLRRYREVAGVVVTCRHAAGSVGPGGVRCCRHTARKLAVAHI